jgi:HEAT repeat protein
MFVELLNDSFKESIAIDALIAIGPPVAETVLERFKTVTDTFQARDVLRILGKIGTAKSLEVLQAVLRQADTFHKMELDDALRAIRQRLNE